MKCSEIKKVGFNLWGTSAQYCVVLKQQSGGLLNNFLFDFLAFHAIRLHSESSEKKILHFCFIDGDPANR